MSATELVHPNELQCDAVDRMPPEVRALVHEYGLSIVHEFWVSGIKSPTTIRHLVGAVRRGCRETGNKRSHLAHPARTILASLDTWLVAEGLPVTALQVVRAIRDGGATVVTTTLPKAAIEASMATVADFDARITKQLKHMRRLQAAMVAADRHFWGPA